MEFRYLLAERGAGWVGAAPPPPPPVASADAIPGRSGCGRLRKAKWVIGPGGHRCSRGRGPSRQPQRYHVRRACPAVRFCTASTPFHKGSRPPKLATTALPGIPTNATLIVRLGTHPQGHGSGSYERFPRSARSALLRSAWTHRPPEQHGLSRRRGRRCSCASERPA